MYPGASRELRRYTTSGGARSAEADVAPRTLRTEVSRAAAVADRASAETTTISETRIATKEANTVSGTNRNGPRRARSLLRGTGPGARRADLDRTVALTPFAALFLTVAELGVVVIALLGKDQFGFRRSQ